MIMFINALICGLKGCGGWSAGRASVGRLCHGRVRLDADRCNPDNGRSRDQRDDGFLHGRFSPF